MNLQINEPCGNIKLTFCGHADIYEYLKEVVSYIEDNDNSRPDFCPLDVFVRVNKKSYHMIKFGTIDGETKEVLKRIEKLPKYKKEIANLESIKIDEFEHEMYIKFDDIPRR